jgi:hypothetical protein
MGVVSTETDKAPIFKMPKAVLKTSLGGTRTQRIRDAKMANHKRGCDAIQEAISTATNDNNDLVLQSLVNKYLSPFPSEKIPNVLDTHDMGNETILNEVQYSAAYHNEYLILKVFAHCTKLWDMGGICDGVAARRSCRFTRTSRPLQRYKYGLSL